MCAAKVYWQWMLQFENLRWALGPPGNVDSSRLHHQSQNENFPFWGKIRTPRYRVASVPTHRWVQQFFHWKPLGRRTVGCPRWNWPTVPAVRESFSLSTTKKWANHCCWLSCVGTTPLRFTCVCQFVNALMSAFSTSSNSFFLTDDLRILALPAGILPDIVSGILPDIFYKTHI